MTKTQLGIKPVIPAQSMATLINFEVEIKGYSTIIVWLLKACIYKSNSVSVS